MPSAKLTISTTRAALLEMLAAATRIAGGPKIIPIYDYVHLEALAPTLPLDWRVTDGQLWRAGTLAAETSGIGAALIPAGLAMKFVKGCSDGPVTLTVEGDRVLLVAGGFRAKMPTLPVEDYPAFPNLSNLDAFTVQTSLLARAVAHVQPITAPFAGGAAWLHLLAERD